MSWIFSSELHCFSASLARDFHKLSLSWLQLAQTRLIYSSITVWKFHDIHLAELKKEKEKIAKGTSGIRKIVQDRII